ncbi:MAG: YggS family pyridoxal phosphate-dependent enzyme [Candidatus Aenigmarchaeota archaeon]|nr:YggS family pyridoxal phosphate-dependent enzyme [Candidatus Aenigmarchaeota archaeon]OYT58007.1 MAG: YggS family pyridoxal phosphate-dependent enzyme [Candidatus Aenigmarchaeota archaeon ex4484_14]RLI97659.1 MAG: YggS family pyridoxal phosphate-dependent enzyme [Candidatus Aenigmarchaeota archaeon]
MSIEENVKKIKQLINEKSKDKVTIVAVTKGRSEEDIKKAMGCGLAVFGENRVQEAIKKWSELRKYPNTSHYELHLIGHLQSNKVRKAVEFFDMIESLDKMKTAEKINRCCGELGKKMNVLIQVNIGEEKTKFGVKPELLMNFLKQVIKLKNINVRGLMTIAPYIEPEKTRIYFKRMKKLFDEAQKIKAMNYLSMGMTNDFIIAIEEGSNMVRIGRGIFGEYGG